MKERTSIKKNRILKGPQRSSPTRPVVVRRLRDQHDAVTRRAILTAARGLFAQNGFSTATMKELAQRAGMAVQTIYSAFGSKAGVLMGLVDLLDEEAGVIDLHHEIQRTNDPRRLVTLYARVRRQIRERCGDIVRTLRAGAGVDPEIARVWAEGMRRRRFGLEGLIGQLESGHALKRGLDPARAADIAAALATDDVCDVLVEQRRWTFDEYESWLSETLATLLLE